MKGVQCCELFGGIALKNHAFIYLFTLGFSVSLVSDRPSNGEIMESVTIFI